MERNRRPMTHGLLENTPGRITCQVCPWLISTGSRRYICEERRMVCMSHRVTGVKTAFGELHGACNWRETFLSPSLVQFYSAGSARPPPRGMGILRKTSETQINRGPMPLGKLSNLSETVFSLRWAHQFLPWVESTQSDSWQVVGAQ